MNRNTVFYPSVAWSLTRLIRQLADIHGQFMYSFFYPIGLLLSKSQTNFYFSKQDSKTDHDHRPNQRTAYR